MPTFVEMSFRTLTPGPSAGDLGAARTEAVRSLLLRPLNACYQVVERLCPRLNRCSRSCPCGSAVGCGDTVSVHGAGYCVADASPAFAAE